MTYLQELDERIGKLLQANLEEAERELSRYHASCKSCRMLNDALVKRTVGGLAVYGLGLREVDDAYYCPACDRCVYARD